MGFLDHSTNNIIIDAVLTDVGRRKLADNNGSFKIAFFSLADDEVDYSIIEQYGRTVGKEKITKNTPVFEAQTANDIALKHRLLTLSDPNVINLPNINLSAVGLTSNAVTLTRGATETVTVSAEQVIGTNLTVPAGSADQSFTVFVPDRFLKLGNGTSPLSVNPSNRIAQYHLAVKEFNTQGGAKVGIDLKIQTIDDTSFTIYGDGQTITTVVSIIGDSSGLRKDFTVNIKKSA